MQTNRAPRIALHSVVAANPLPFLVIDESYVVVAANEAFRRRYDPPGGTAVGRHCFEVAHGNERPCDEVGEECPHRRVRGTGAPYTCTHVHLDADGRGHRVRVTVHPLEADDGRMLLGETIEELAPELPVGRDDEVPAMVGDAPAYVAALEQLGLAARTDFPVLLLGETGTGKELAAGFVHRHSVRRGAPFLTLDCTTLPEALFESQVFGHERGAFTDSAGERQGLFELADGGTLFLDEIGELPLAIQAKLLRALESGEFRRVGGQRARQSDVRVICATNRHLWERVEQRQFREDLYYRIACLTVRLPALRERRSDVPALARSLAGTLAGPGGGIVRITNAALELLAAQSYPGNVRQLRNVVNAAAAHSRDGCIDAPEVLQVLPSTLPEVAGPGVTAPERAGETADSLCDRECQYIRELLARYDGNRRKVAERLGISTRTLYRKLNRYQLRSEPPPGTG